MQATVTQQPARHLLALRHAGPYYEIGHTFEKLATFAQSHGIPMHESVAVYYDDPGVVPMHELRSDAAVLVDAEFALPSDHPGAMHLTQLPAGEFITATYVGGYDGLSDAWSRFMGEAAPALGHPIGGLTFEIYRSRCGEDPNQLRTDLYVSVGH